MIRSAVDADSEAVLALLHQLSVSFTPDADAFSRNYPTLIADPATVLLVAEEDSRVVGYALAALSTLLYTNGLSAQLQELVVDENHRSTGIGTDLLSAVEAECLLRGARQLTVASRRASAFYADRGYTVTADFLKKPL